MNNILIDFIKEFILRFSKKSPTFFKIISGLSMAVALVSGLPGLFQELNIALPSWAEIFQNKIVAWASTIAFLISKLTVDKERLDVPKDVLPFTTKQDKP